MHSDARLEELLDLWEALRAEGREIATVLLCRDCPELAGALAERVRALRAMEWMDSALATATPAGSGVEAAGKPWVGGALPPGYRLVGPLGRGGAWRRHWADERRSGTASACNWC
jgi:hypothetical protein